MRLDILDVQVFLEYEEGARPIEEQAVSTSAELGQAILGVMILGKETYANALCTVKPYER